MVTLNVGNTHPYRVLNPDGSLLAPGDLRAGARYRAILEASSPATWRLAETAIARADAAAVRDRATHTGTQPISSVSGLLDRLAASARSGLLSADGQPVEYLVPLLRGAADFYIDSDDYPPGPVASIAAHGRLSSGLAIWGSGDDIVKTTDGLLFAGGKYLRSVGQAVPAKRISVVIDLAVGEQRAGSQSVLTMEFSTPASLIMLPGDWSADRFTPWVRGAGGALLRSMASFPLDERHVLAASLDMTGTVVGVDPDGYRLQAKAPEHPLTLNGMRIGFGINAVIRRAAIFLEDL